MATALPGLSAVRGLVALALSGQACSSTEPDGDGTYGLPVPLASTNTSETLLALPPGFQYTAFGRTSSMMTDGRPTPGSHDGMAAFQVGGELRLVRNHERRLPNPPGSEIVAGGPSYDPNAPGGTTTVIVDPTTRTLVSSWASLSGTIQNCAGGATPWGTWISCEEATGGTAAGYTQPHGYCFEVAAAANAPVTPVRLTAMGRFVHEAVAVDPATGIVYLTEDAGSAGLYRFIPTTPGQLAAGGQLQMLAVAGDADYDTRVGQSVLTPLPVTWVDIADPDPANAEAQTGAVGAQGFDQGAAIFARLEGAFFGGGRLYVNATSGGTAGLGQVWEYQPEAAGGTLRLLYESPGVHELSSPDNLCVSPRGGGLVLCEDADTVCHLRGLTRHGHIFEFARNVIPGLESQEFAGATFSPDGQTLFVNVQSPGITFAIWGPWDRGAL